MGRFIGFIICFAITSLFLTPIIGFMVTYFAFKSGEF